jgi:hypothetical protein
MPAPILAGAAQWPEPQEFVMIFSAVWLHCAKTDAIHQRQSWRNC